MTHQQPSKPLEEQLADLRTERAEIKRQDVEYLEWLCSGLSGEVCEKSEFYRGVAEGIAWSRKEFKEIRGME